MFGRKKLQQEIERLNKYVKKLEKCLEDERKPDVDIYTDEMEAEKNKVYVVVDFANLFSIERLDVGKKNERSIICIKCKELGETKDLVYYCSRKQHNGLCEHFNKVIH